MGYVQFDEALLKFDVTGEELRNHCNERSEFHKARRDFYAKKEEEFANEAEEFKSQQPASQGGFMSGAMSSNTMETQKQQMANQKKHHSEKRTFFAFSATHLKQEVYQLTKAQLQEMEMVF